MDPDLYRNVLRRCSEMRHRYWMLDLTENMGILDDLIAEAY